MNSEDTTWRDLEIFRKTTKNYELIVTNESTGRAEDITDWEINFTVKKNMKDTDEEAVITKDIGLMSGADSEHSDPTNGKTIITIDPDETDLTGVYYYDIKYVKGDGNTGIIVRGRIKFIETVTQR